MTLIIIVVACSGVFALQQLHHCGSSCWIRGLSGNDLHHQTCGGVGREFVTILPVWATRHTLATVCVFAERLLIDVDVCVTKRREIAVDGVAFMLPLLHLFRRQLVTASGVREHVEHVLRCFV